MKAKLLAVGGDVKATEIVLKLPTVIGRGRDATLTLPHPLVSRKHCELFESDEQLMVRDLGSLNGTYVGNQRVTEAVVPSGELLTIATVNFRVIYGGLSDLDDTELPPQVDGEESTSGPGEVQSGSGSRERATQDVGSNAPPPEASQFPIDRDTEWQLGNTLPKKRSGDDDDGFSSFLNELP